MFKKGDKVVHSDYGTGEIWKVNPNHVVKHKDKNNIQISHRGTIEIAFDSEMGEDDGNGTQNRYLNLRRNSLILKKEYFGLINLKLLTLN